MVQLYILYISHVHYIARINNLWCHFLPKSCQSLSLCILGSKLGPLDLVFTNPALIQTSARFFNVLYRTRSESWECICGSTCPLWQGLSKILFPSEPQWCNSPERKRPCGWGVVLSQSAVWKEPGTGEEISAAWHSETPAGLLSE